MPWQQYVADVALEIGPDGLPAYHQVIIVVMRQQGKTELMLPLMTHRAMQFGPNQRILYTTQTGSEARKKWEDIHVARLQAPTSPFRSTIDVRLRLNAEQISFPNGSTWSPGAPTTKAGGTGETINLAVIDEAWSRPDNRQELAMRPAMLTQPDRQLWICSMVPGASRAKTVDSAYLRQKVAMGRRLTQEDVREGIAYFEWAAPENAEPGDPETWWGCMPALGRTISPGNVKADWETMSAEGKEIDFCAEYLGWWPQDARPVWQVIKQSAWQALRDRESSIHGRLAFAVDMDPERNTATIAAAGKRSDGDWHVEIVEPGGAIDHGMPTLDWVEPRVAELVDKWDPVAVVVDPKGPAKSLIVPLTNRDIEVTTPNILEVSAACERFYDRTHAETGDTTDRIRHLGQPELDRAIAGARKLISPTHGTFVWQRVGGSANISPLYAVTLAMHGYEMNSPEDYDPLDSVF